MALAHLDDIKDLEIKEQIENLLGPYKKNPAQYFVERLAEGVGLIAGAFYPRPVIVRFSDFKTNEYANLIGGKAFEPKEENPMMAWRGASRYYDKQFIEAFSLERMQKQGAIFNPDKLNWINKEHIKKLWQIGILQEGW